MFRAFCLSVCLMLAAAAQTDPLTTARQKIDAIDERIVELLNERATVVEEIGRFKKAKGLPVTAPGREQEVVRRVAALSHGPLPVESVKRIYERIITEMREWEARR